MIVCALKTGKVEKLVPLDRPAQNRAELIISRISILAPGFGVVYHKPPSLAPPERTPERSFFSGSLLLPLPSAKFGSGANKS